MPALEAMAAGVPVIASNRGPLPEVVADAGLLIDPSDPRSRSPPRSSGCSAISPLWHNLRERGLARARAFTWAQTARGVRRAYEDAVMAHAHRH